MYILARGYVHSNIKKHLMLTLSVLAPIPSSPFINDTTHIEDKNQNFLFLIRAFPFSTPCCEIVRCVGTIPEISPNVRKCYYTGTLVINPSQTRISGLSRANVGENDVRNGHWQIVVNVRGWAARV